MNAHIKLNKPIDYKKEIIASTIEIDQQAIELSRVLFNSAVQALKNGNNPGPETESKIIFNMFQKWQFSVFQNTVVITVAKYLKDFFDVTYDEKAIKLVVDDILSKNQNAKEIEIKEFVKQSEFSMAIWNYLAKEWDVIVTDDDANRFLDDYYKNTNNSIREFKQDKDKFEKIKEDIKLRKIIDLCGVKFNVKILLSITNPAQQGIKDEKSKKTTKSN
ncbi:MAG: hypothetical protein Ta2E_04810 [Mycoplasmoidaceae bacterium]|nr:MAG: hypothetical protein Ta2E_04810 [Mycoplasmoidaceae bacterium]